MNKVFVRLFATLAVAFAIATSAPALASAQAVTSCGYTNWVNNTLTNCGSGTLLTYVSVNNRSGDSYLPSQAIVTVSGVNPSQNSFPGSLSGTTITLGVGSYSVSVNPMAGYTASYSNGCSGTMHANNSATCVVTLNPNNNYPPYNPCSYCTVPPVYTTLSCVPSVQNAAFGQTVSFTAAGGFGGSNNTYTWSTLGRTVSNTGPVYTTSFTSSGTHAVTVTNGTQVAQCIVNVGSAASTIIPTVITPVTSAMTSYVVPLLPNTGFAPMTSAAIAFTLVVFAGIAFLAYPYAKRAFSTILG